MSEALRTAQPTTHYNLDPSPATDPVSKECSALHRTMKQVQNKPSEPIACLLPSPTPRFGNAIRQDRSSPERQSMHFWKSHSPYLVAGHVKDTAFSTASSTGSILRSQEDAQSCDKTSACSSTVSVACSRLSGG